MDEKLTEIWKNEYMRWKIIFIVISAVLSAVFAYITQNIVLTIIFIIVTACIDLLVELYEYIKFDFYIKRIFGMKVINRYILFVILAILPAFLGFIKLVYSNQIGDQELLINVCNNLFSNVFGALIVCSIINHIKFCKYDQIIENIIVLRKDLYSTFVKIAIFACFVNAVNFDFNSDLSIMNKANKIYLLFIIFYGMLVFYAFALRIIDKTPFSHPIKKIYPTGVLIWSGAFLISCNFSTYLGSEKSSNPILLLINTITIFTIAIGVLFLLSRRAENSSDSYPWKRLFVFFIVIGVNGWFGFKLCEDKGDIVKQIISGGAIFGVSLALVLYLARKQNLKDKIEK